MTLWDYCSHTRERKVWQAWVRSAMRCRMEPVKRVACMVRKHLEGILTAVVQRVSNARAKGIKASIQWMKCRVRGYRNRQRFGNAIYFHSEPGCLPPWRLSITPYPHEFLKSPFL